METIGTITMWIAVFVVIAVWEFRYSQLKKAQKKHWEKIIDLAQTTDRRMVKSQQREVEVDNLLNAQTELIKSVVANRKRTEEKVGLLDKQIDQIIKTVTTLANSEAEFKSKIGKTLEEFKTVLNSMSNKQEYIRSMLALVRELAYRIMVLEKKTKENSIYMAYEEWNEMIAKEKERIKAEKDEDWQKSVIEPTYPLGTETKGEEGGVGYTTHKYDGKEITIVNNPEWNKPDVPDGEEVDRFPGTLEHLMKKEQGDGC